MAIVLIRTLIVYFSLLLAMRLLGKRQLGELELSEFVVAALIADMAAHPLQDIGIPLLNGLIPIVTLFCCEVLIAGFSLRSIRLRRLLFGSPSILVSHGKIDQNEMRKNRFTPDELMQELRSQGFTDISRVEYAVLETDGKLNVLPYPGEGPVTAAMLKISVPDVGYPIVVVNDGRILEENLRLSGRDLRWLSRELKKGGHDGADTVYLMTVNSAGQVYLAGKEPKS